MKLYALNTQLIAHKKNIFIVLQTIDYPSIFLILPLNNLYVDLKYNYISEYH